MVHRGLKAVRVAGVGGLALAGLIGWAGEGAFAQQSRKTVAPPAVDSSALAAAMPAPTACSRGYSSALAGLARTLPDEFRQAKSTLRSPIAGLSPRWLFNEAKAPLEWATLTPAKGRQAASLAGEGPCAALVVSADTAACKVAPVSATQTAAAPRRPAGDAPQVQRLLEVYRRANGVAPEAMPDGKFYWPLERVSWDLAAYVSQRESASICSGAPEMLEFVAAQVALPSRRNALLKDVTRLAGNAALSAIAGLGEKAPPSTATVQDANALLLIAATALIPNAAGAIAAAPKMNDRLKLAAAAVRALPPADAQAARAVFAPIEVFAFAGDMAARYGLYEKAYLGGMDAMRAAHKTHCTCADQ